MATQSWVNKEGVKHAPMWGHSVKDQRSVDVVSYFHTLGAVHHEVQDPIAQGVGLKLNDELGRSMVLNTEL